MATRKDPLILRRNSDDYRRHESQIHDVIDRAYDLNLLRFLTNKQIFPGMEGRFADRDIVCDVPRGDESQSVARSYFATAITADRQEARLPPESEAQTADTEEARITIDETREMLYRILAIHFSINDAVDHREGKTGEPPVDVYAELLSANDKAARANGIVTLLPNLFDAASLSSCMQQNPYDLRNEDVRAYILGLAEILSAQPNHLHALSTGISRTGAHDLAAGCVEEAGKMYGEKPEAVCERNPFQADSYAEALLESGQHEKLTGFCEDFGMRQTVTRANLAERYIRALLALQQYDKLHAFFTEHASALHSLMNGEKHVRKCVGIATVELGWVLYGNGQYKEGMELIMTLVPHELTRDDVKALHDALKEYADEESTEQ